ncbi:hypothetical protein [Streptomyces olivaceoviridis]|uniref:hypothetical protein n=1 Tax=Streptomyces olivaceoviridis TaxID=1921 RepID=UPI00369034E6
MRPARKHNERLDVDGEAVDIKLGTFLDNTRRRADKLTPDRRAELDQLGMRWQPEHGRQWDRHPQPASWGAAAAGSRLACAVPRCQSR